jgi:hypothetical protein
MTTYQIQEDQTEKGFGGSFCRGFDLALALFSDSPTQ